MIHSENLLDDISLPKIELRKLLLYVYRMGKESEKRKQKGEEYICLSEAARRSNLDRSIIKNAIDRKELDSKKMQNSRNSKVLISVEQFELWLQTK